MKKFILILMVLFSNSIFAQASFILKIEPVKIYRNDKTLSKYLNVQLSYYHAIDDKFFYELQPGIIFADPAIHMDFLFDYKPTIFFLKAGIMVYLGFAGGGNSGTTTEFYSLPIIGTGVDLGKKILIELNYTFAYFTLGIGYRF